MCSGGTIGSPVVGRPASKRVRCNKWTASEAAAFSMQKGRPTIGDSLDFIPITHALGQAFRLTIAAPVSGPRRALSGNVIFPLGAHIPTHFIPRRATMTWIANDDNSTAYFSARGRWS